jgi:hypothetical protein
MLHSGFSTAGMTVKKQQEFVMIRKIIVIIILGCVIAGIATPALAAGSGGSGGSGGIGGDGGSGGSGGSGGLVSGSESASGSGGSNGADTSGGSSSGNGGSGSSSSGSGATGSESSSSGTGGQGASGPMGTGQPIESPTQEQSQTRNQTPGTGLPGAVPIQEQLQSRDQTHLEDQYLQQVHDRQSQLSQDQQLARDQQRLTVDVALYSVTVAEPVIGMNGTSFNQMAQQINQSYAILDQEQTRIQDQNPIVRFFLGGNRTAAQTILNVTAQDQDRIRLMEQDLQSCSCNQTIREQLMQQLTTLSQDQDRLRTFANQTLQDRGVFGGFFR